MPTYDPTIYYLGALGSEQPMTANDGDFQHTVEDLIREQRLPSGRLIRYKMKQIHHWQWRYKWLPGQRGDVFDRGMSRDDLYALYQADAVMNFLVVNQGAPHTTYSVRFAAGSWREGLAQRAGAFWAYENVTFELVQVS